MQKQTPDISVVYVNYKTINLIVNSIDSLIKKTKAISYEIIVVDNNSNDDFSIIINKQFGSQIKCIALNENLGFGKANNEGYKIANGRNIFFLNPDTIILNNALKILSDYLDQNDKVGVCGGNLYDENMEPTHSYCTFIPSISFELKNCLFPIVKLETLFGENYEFNNSNRPKKVKYISGADIMIKNDVLKKCGTFSNDFFMYYEETELCFRIRKNGFDIVSIPNAHIQHLEGKSFQIDPKDFEKIRKKRLIALDGEKIFYKLCYSKLYILILLLIKGVSTYSKFFVAKIINDKNLLVYNENKLNYLILIKNNEQ